MDILFSDGGMRIPWIYRTNDARRTGGGQANGKQDQEKFKKIIIMRSRGVEESFTFNTSGSTCATAKPFLRVSSEQISHLKRALDACHSSPSSPGAAECRVSLPHTLDPPSVSFFEHSEQFRTGKRANK